MQINRFMLCFWMLLFLITGCGHQTKDVEKPTVDTIPMMVMQIQKCSRLYTTEYQLRKIVTYGDSVSINGSFLHQDFKIDLPMGRRKVAIPMTANVKAYIDFSNFSEKNIKKHDGKIEIILPDPEFIMTSTQVNHAGIKKKVSVLRKNFSDEEITRLQQQGRNDMIKSLPKLGIMENARQNAARQIFPIIEQMGYSSDDVTITFRKKFTWNDFPSLIKKTE
ncbi:hypothetical protein HMPREF0645_1871 [Hallella bergensis DSM 17361]|uniref:DUF4230 domain-containing protein n=1 Tax=Hallella bergensis DSM 17361 TaxID=585502 RepID=D1PY36_9BACT|nr:DUF4230 domain-containing protein [Hallella bergensis]EFA43709.1 hypothetical protein HMPREF0645_1871 [Hallella bergensis DSM 17361]